MMYHHHAHAHHHSAASAAGLPTVSSSGSISSRSSQVRKKIFHDILCQIGQTAMLTLTLRFNLFLKHIMIRKGSIQYQIKKSHTCHFTITVRIKQQIHINQTICTKGIKRFTTIEITVVFVTRKTIALCILKVFMDHVQEFPKGFTFPFLHQLNFQSILSFLLF